MVDKDDHDCAHLVLVSLSYLLDFLKAADFLGCERIKGSLEERIKEKITDTTWREVFTASKDIMGLQTMTNIALAHLMKNITTFYNAEVKVTLIVKF